MHQIKWGCMHPHRDKWMNKMRVWLVMSYSKARFYEIHNNDKDQKNSFAMEKATRYDC